MENSSNQITYRISSDSSSPVLPRGFGNGEGVAAVLVVCPGSASADIASAASVAVMIHFANWLLPDGGDPLLRRITPESSFRPAWPLLPLSSNRRGAANDGELGTFWCICGNLLVG